MKDQIFDVVNNKICPFCHYGLLEVDQSIAGAKVCAYYQCHDHLEVGYELKNKPWSNTPDSWVVIRVCPSGFDKPIFHKWYDTGYGEDAIISIHVSATNATKIVSVPVFPIFNYSLEQLANKIKTFTLFS